MPSFSGHPLFDTAENLEDQGDFHRHPSIPEFFESLSIPSELLRADYEITRKFLLKYSDVQGTFVRFRSEVQRFLNYLWVTSKRTLVQTDSDVMTAYFKTLTMPPKSWISRGIYSAFQDRQGLRLPNAQWRPFAIRTTKGAAEDTVSYAITQASLNASKTALQTFFKYLLIQDYVQKNPMIGMRKRDQKVQTINDVDTETDVRRLSDMQWAYLLESLMLAADENRKYERHLFVVVTMKSLFLRVSELAPRQRQNGSTRTPVFGDFKRKFVQGEEYWAYYVFSKGDKDRTITLPDEYLPYLQRWREHLGCLTAMPVQGDNHPILPSAKGGALSKRQIQRVYEQAIMLAVDRLDTEGRSEEARQLESIRTETHYLRHTGASQAIEAGADIRHISEELGHASAAFTESVYVNSDQAMRRFAGRKRRV
ncbi:Tyrosine recombinase XerC [Marinobacter litoralis]|uniref:Tyrosine recombinase XerC n=1 Tax=Marinobacter litoralis TaxID=187981 RepID=A0A3M2RLX2_9GAMM|nr:tyrosine-type recombinase/integrase [Marinobacter litoralis]RMJ06350.1 Tyrosine recombinase XerC [Marinobacter litoralis]